jgi:concanavalin A-like lectin/glucanase superfamily protein
MRFWTAGARAAQCAAVGLGLGVLAGCPQLLDDSFKVRSQLPDVGPDSLPEPPAAGADAGGLRPRPGPKDAGTGLGALLTHRYEFNGRGNTVLDSIGTANGTSIGVSLDGSGKLTFSSNDQYVDLPSGLISKLESVSIECWVNWAGSSPSYARDGTTGAWQNLFTFGTSDQGEGQQGNGTRYIYLTPQPPRDYGTNVRAGYSLTGFNSESFVSGKRPLPVSSDPERGTQVVYVLDSVRNQLAIYIDGSLETAVPSSQQIDLSAIPDVNNWLGRSQFAASPGFLGELLDVRIYGAALGAAQVELSFELGPDASL